MKILQNFVCNVLSLCALQGNKKCVFVLKLQTHIGFFWRIYLLLKHCEHYTQPDEQSPYSFKALRMSNVQAGNDSIYCLANYFLLFNVSE